MSIREGKTYEHDLALFIFTLIHLDPFQAVGTEGLGFTWIAEILNSGYPEVNRYEMASRVVQVLGRHFFPEVSISPSPNVKSAWIPPLLDFLLLCEKFCTKESPYPRFIALRILSTILEPVDFAATILPVLSLTLLSTHPLQPRSLALKVFHAFVSGWFSPQVENVLNKDRDKLLRAVGDPFQHLDSPLHCGRPMVSADGEAIKATIVLIEFASSSSWQSHLRRSNFTSCEEIMSTEEGTRNALICMLRVATRRWTELLHTPEKIVAAIRRLEELQCLNTAQVVIMWAWTIGVVNPVDRVGWKLIQDETLRFYNAHGVQRLVALALHIIDTTTELTHEFFIRAHYKNSPYRVGCVRRPDPTLREPCSGVNQADLYVSQACQLEEVDEEMGVPSGYSVTPDSFADWVSNYP